MDNRTKKLHVGGERKAGHDHHLKSLVISVAASILMACSGNNTPVSEPIKESPAGLLDISTGENDLALKANIQEYNRLLTQLHNSHGINVIIASPGTIKGVHDHGVEKGYVISYHKNIDNALLSHAIAYLQEIIHGLTAYGQVFSKQLQWVVFVDRIIDKGEKTVGVAGFAGPGVMALSVVTSREITSYLQNQYRTIFHHEFSHLIHFYESGIWPFQEGKSDTWDKDQLQQEKGFARTYGTKNKYEDVATIGEILMSAVMYDKERQIINNAQLSEDKRNAYGNYASAENKPILVGKVTTNSEYPYRGILERMKTDYLLAQKIMFMTGSYFDAEEGKFIWDFTPVEFRHYFHIKGVETLPFYTRMKEKGKYDYAFWNRVLSQKTTSFN